MMKISWKWSFRHNHNLLQFAVKKIFVCESVTGRFLKRKKSVFRVTCYTSWSDLKKLTQIFDLHHHYYRLPLPRNRALAHRMGQIVPTLWACPPSGKPTTSQWARKFKVQTKKLVKSNKSILRPIFLTKIHFLQFLRWPQKSIFWTAQKCNFTGEKKFWIFREIDFFFISRDFLPGLFKIFWPVVILGKILMPYSNSKKKSPSIEKDIILTTITHSPNLLPL